MYRFVNHTQYNLEFRQYESEGFYYLFIYFKKKKKNNFKI